MPKSRSLFINIFVFSLFTSPFSLLPSTAHATTDPQYATSSATATVPSTTTSVNPGDTTAPTTPILISPADGAHSSDDTPEFVWSQSSDPNGNTVTYTFYLNGIATYLGISNIGNSAGVGYTSRIDAGQIILTPNNGYNDGSYNWYVVASDPSNNHASSTQWNLTIDRVAPVISITDIDTYHNLTLSSNSPESFEGLNFDINGTKDIVFSILAEPYSTLTLQFLNSDGTLVSQQTVSVDGTGLAYPHTVLQTGVYTIAISAYDLASNTTALPSFTITVSDAQITVPLPEIPGLPGLPNELNIPLPTNPTSTLPASISQVSSRLRLSSLIYLLLAIAMLGLLYFIWYKKPNIILVDLDGKPLSNTILYHSIPTNRSQYNPILVTKREPISYTLSDRNMGKLYIHRLSRYSTLTIRTSTATHILSISTVQKVYKISL
jgi:hypothetical protein